MRQSARLPKRSVEYQTRHGYGSENFSACYDLPFSMAREFRLGCVAEDFTVFVHGAIWKSAICWYGLICYID